MSGAFPCAVVELAFLDVGFGEFAVVGVVALLVFGGELPDVMRKVGRAYSKLRRSLDEAARPVRDELRGARRAMERDIAENAPPAGASTTQPPPGEEGDGEPWTRPAPVRYEPDAPTDRRPEAAGRGSNPFDEPPPV